MDMPDTPPQADLSNPLNAADRDALERYGQIRQFAKGEFIFRAGTPSRHVCLLRRGRVKIYQASETGKEVILWFCNAGDLFGLAEATQGGERAVSALACENAEVVSLSQPHFAAFVQDHPHAAIAIMQILSGRLRTLSDALVDLVSDDVQTRIVKLIARLGTQHLVRNDKSICINVRLTHQEIADMTGTTRQTVSSVLSALKRQGLLCVKRDRIHVLDESVLATLGVYAHFPPDDARADTLMEALASPAIQQAYR
jgi:CRP-like cAMP-binding protein